MFAPANNIHSLRPLDWLLSAGCHVTLVDRDDPGRANHDRYRFVRYPHALGASCYRKLFTLRTARRLTFLDHLVQLRLLWRRVRPDVVHVHWVDKRAYRVARAGLRPLVLSVWGSDINVHFLPEASSYGRRTTGSALAAAARVIVDAPDMPDKCARLAGRPVHTELLPLGVDTKIFSPDHPGARDQWRRRLRIPSDARVILSVRGFSRRYGHHQVLQAFADALPRFRTSAFLTFVVYNERAFGESAAYRLELEHLATALGVNPRVRWIPELPHPRMPEIYAFADIVVNYPSMDAFPVTFFEAAACERPVISVQLPAYAGTFAETYFRMVEPTHLSSLSDALVELVNDREGRPASTLAAARRAVQQEYDESMSRRRLLDIYTQLSPEPPPGSVKVG